MVINYISWGVMVLLISGLSWWLYRLHQRLAKLLAGKTAASLEPALLHYQNQVELTNEELKKLQAAYDKVAGMAELASQKVSIVRFNPFGDTGGDQSFSLAVLDAHHSGYVLSSIHGREGTRVYVKPIDFGNSKYPLSKEEQKALGQAEKRTIANSKPKE